MANVDLSQKRVVVTGGAGFLGRAVCRVLRRRGVSESRLFVPRRREFNLTLESDVERLYASARPQVVFHLAAEVGGIGANMAERISFIMATARSAWSAMPARVICLGGLTVIGSNTKLQVVRTARV